MRRGPMTTSDPTLPREVFLLGGADLEMRVIGDLVRAHCGAAAVRDRGLGWGARLSDHADDIAGLLARGQVPVAVELAPDMIEDGRLSADDVVLIDHHGARAGADRPGALQQVFERLGLDRARHWTRELDLVAANDIGHIAAMKALSPPASPAELQAIRLRDRQAQGVTAAEERAAIRAVADRRTCLDGKLTLLRLEHDRATAAADLMEPDLGGPGYASLLLQMPGEWAFYGHGAAVMALDRTFPGGWYGGALPQCGFWGIRRQEDITSSALIDILRPAL